MAQRRALVTGSTGYIGGRLVPRLIEAGFAVRVLVRFPEKLHDVPWADEVEIIQGDLADVPALEAACTGVDVFYYLVHSMGQRGDFEARELESARAVGGAALRAGVQRIVYLGGLHPESKQLSSAPAPRSATSCSIPGFRRRRCRPASSSGPARRASR